MYIIGIDGGGTNTIGYLADYNCNILAVAKVNIKLFISGYS